MYTLNCMVYGKCTVYAWLSVILTVLSLLATVVSVTGIHVSKSSTKIL
jgi:heme exporter protein D